MSYSFSPQAKSVSRFAATGLSLSLTLVVLAGCPADKSPEATKSGGATTSSTTTSTTTSTTVNASSDPAQVAAVSTADYAKANELGDIAVMEYHRFEPKEARWSRTPANFRKDLEFFYNNGYVLVNAADLAERKMNIPAGKKPLVFTFDDSTEGQFKYLTGPDKQIKRDAQGKPMIDPDCAVGIMDAFYAKHPDFGRAGSFYVLPSGFEQDAGIKEKFQYLVATGREIGNHSWAHDNMSGMSVSQVNSAIGKLQTFIHQQVGNDYEVKTLALPFGIAPRGAEAFKAVSKGGSGTSAYNFKLLLLVGADPADSPYSKAYKSTAVARIQAIDSEFQSWFNRKPGSTAVARLGWTPYISDGDPARVTFPAAWQKRFNPASLPTGVTANPFDPAKVAAQAAAAASPAASAAVSASPTTDSPAPAASGSATTSPMPSGQSAASAAPVSSATDTHPGYQTKLPAGALYDQGKVTYKIKAGDSVEAIAYKMVKFTDFYTYPKLASAIRQANGGNRALKIGETLTIPNIRSAPPKASVVKRDKGFEAKGIYVTGTTAGSENMWALVKSLKAHGGNTVVFDAKDMNGVISYKSAVPLAKELHAYQGDMISDMPKMLERLHKEDIHAVARLTLFHDMKLAQKKPQMALRSKRSGRPWLEFGHLNWVDPSLPAVQDYNLALAKELIAMGVDEIQYDYVRFPAMSDTPDIKWSTIATQKTKSDVITAWVKRAHEELKPLGAMISADVYGVVAWDQGIDVRITGQKIEEMGKYMDAISPMLYPSHFYSNFDKFDYPPDHPEYFIGEGVKKFARRTAGTGVTIRPWLQAFPYRIRNYGPKYVEVQLNANHAAKGTGWLLWNAENNYKVGFAGVDMHKKKNQVASSPH